MLFVTNSIAIRCGGVDRSVDALDVSIVSTDTVRIVATAPSDSPASKVEIEMGADELARILADSGVLADAQLRTSRVYSDPAPLPASHGDEDGQYGDLR